MSDYDIVRSRDQLQIGDHVSIPTEMASGMFQHHAIIEAWKGGNLFKLIHVRVSGGNSSYCSGSCSCGSNQDYRVGEDVVDFSKKMQSGELRRYRYAPGDCKEPFEVIKRAKELFGTFSFCVLHNNCEHFARLVKTGIKESRQVQKAVNTAVVAGSTGASAFTAASFAGASLPGASFTGLGASLAGASFTGGSSEGSSSSSCVIL